MSPTKFSTALIASLAAVSTALPTAVPTTTESSQGYVCNPAHSYPAGASCDNSGPTPTLVIAPTSTVPAYTSAMTTAPPKAGDTLSNGAYVCNPAHSYPNAACDGKASPPTLIYSSTSSTSASAPTAAVKIQSAAPQSCPLSLDNVPFQFPHLLVTSTNNQQTSNTLYSATISSSTTSFFNFDIPPEYAGKTCNVVFALPRQDQLQTSSFTLAGAGPLVFSSLAGPAAQSSAVPQTAATLGAWNPAPGNAVTVASGPCAAGQTIGYSISAQGDAHLDYFQNYGQCPIGLYITTN